MENRSFFNLSAKECALAYPIVVENGDRHGRVAAILADNNEYGNAVSHLILGAEELLKATLLVMESKGFNLRHNKSIGKLFSHHWARHAIFKEPLSIWLFFQRLIKNGSNSASNKGVGFFGMAVRFFYGAMDGYLNYAWWDQADERKERGFYVDWCGSLVDPGSITKEQYEIALHHSKSLQRELKKFIALIGNAGKEKVAYYIDLFKASGAEELLTETIFKSNPSFKANE
jgi:AbiV family abortive infection protein